MVPFTKRLKAHESQDDIYPREVPSIDPQILEIADWGIV